MRYRRDYQITHDIDWFFLHKGRVYHAASNGGLIPDKVDSKTNRIIQEELENVVGQYEVEMAMVERQHDEDISSFVKYASMGFISLDRSENDDEMLKYHRVAYPINGGTFEDDSLLKLMPLLADNEIMIE